MYKNKHNHKRNFLSINSFKSYLILIVCFILCNNIYSQKQDSLQAEDSLKTYRKIQHIAYKNKFTAWAYSTIFVPPEPIEYPILPIGNQKKQINPYLKHEGRIIKEIRITTYDPFGHNVIDTVEHDLNSVQKFGNKLHITTRHFVIINKLLFKINDTINPLALSESERILRATDFVNDARIYISKSDEKNKVIVNVIIHDKWPIVIPFLITDVFVDARFKNRNLFGIGQQFTQYAKYNRSGDSEFNGDYGIANIDNTYISGLLSYLTNKDETSISLSFDRPFFSPLAKWAGGISTSHSWKKYTYRDSTIGEDKTTPLNNLSYDLWLSKSFTLINLSENKSLFNQSSNIIIGGRYYAGNYLARPSYAIDTSQSHYNSSAGIGNVGFSLQQYYKDKYIYRFGANEDVPEGLIMQLTYGGLRQEYKKMQYYLGFEIARAKHFNIGYLSGTFSYGVFFNKYISNNTTANYKLYYFSNLFKKGNWLFREFVNLQIVHGKNKSAGETTSFSGDELYGFENKNLFGTTKITLTSETVSFLPYQLIGFKFAPVINMGFGLIGDSKNRVLKSNLYQAYTIGVMIRNENLLNSTFQFSVGAYPFFPNGEKNILKYNPIASFTLRVRAFSISKPSFVSF